MGCCGDTNVKFIAVEAAVAFCEITNEMSEFQVITNNNSNQSDSKKTMILMTLRQLVL